MTAGLATNVRTVAGDIPADADQGVGARDPYRRVRCVGP